MQETRLLGRKARVGLACHWRWFALAFTLLLSVLGSFGPTQAQDSSGPELIDVTAAVPRDFPPQYSVDETGKPIGFAIDVMDQIASLAGLRVTYLVGHTWREVAEALRSGRADLIPNNGITPEREAEFAFTAPVETFAVSIFVRRPTTDIQSNADLTGRKVAAVETNVAVSLLQDRRDVELVVFKNVNEALFQLLAGQVDALVYPQPVVLKTARSIGVENRIKVVGEPLIEIKRAIAVRKEDTELLARLDEAVNQFVGTAEYQQIYVKWYGQPEPFWTVSRLAWLMGGLLLLTLVTMLVWRYLSVTRLNRQLVENVVQRVRTEEALRESETRFRSIIAQAYDGISIVDEQGRVVAWNQAMENISGLGAQDVLNRPIWDVQFQMTAKEQRTPEMHAQLKAGLLEFLKTGRASWMDRILEREYIHPDGRCLIVQRVISAIETDKGFILVSSSHDITERKRAEEVLREAELRYRTVADFTYDWEYWEGADGTLCYVSPACERITGYAADQFLDNPFLLQEIILPEDSETWARHRHQATAAPGLREVQFRIQRQDGEVVWIEHACQPVVNEQGTFLGFRASNRDITERKQMEKALAVREKEYRTLVEHIPDFVVRYDTDLRRVYVNPAWEEASGLSAREVINVPAADIPRVPKPAVAEYMKKLREVQETGSPQAIEFTWVNAYGVTLFLEYVIVPEYDQYGKVVGLLCVGHDLTERKRAEEALREAELRYRTVADFTYDWEYWEELDGTLCYVSPACERITGYAADQFLNKPLLLQEIILPEDSEAWARHHHQATAASGLREVQFRIQRQDGEVVWIEHACQPVVNEQGAFLGFRASNRDITERKRVEEELRISEERLRALSHRLVEVQEAERRHIARELHDEIGQALTALRLLLETSMNLPVDLVKSKLGQTLTLVDELTTRVQELSLDLRPAMLDDLGLLPTLVWHFGRYTDRTNVRVDFKYIGPETRLAPEIETAAYRIVQEGLTNVARHAGVSEVIVQLWLDRDMLRVQIEDEGTGFDPQATLASGATSGLSGMQERAVLLGGHLTIESAPGAGTSLMAELPLGDSVEDAKETR